MRYPSGFTLDAAFITSSDITALFGPSGSGKTSILSIIAGLRRPHAGLVRHGSRVLFDSAQQISLAPQARRIGYVFQDQLLFPHLTVQGNLMYGWRRRRQDARPVDFQRVVQVLELNELLARMPYTLSGGECQRVALGRALLCGPELLLLDEPLASLDQALKDRVLDYVEQVLKEWRIPTLYVSHDAGDVRRLAEDVVVVEAGKVTYTGSVASFLN
jgi:molybdate transport system ATP-binding protein